MKTFAGLLAIVALTAAGFGQGAKTPSLPADLPSAVIRRKR